MAAMGEPCSSCKQGTKYHCITCALPVCNRPECSVAEPDDDTAGWVAQSSVAYCNDCVTGEQFQLDVKQHSTARTEEQQSLSESESITEDVDESSPGSSSDDKRNGEGKKLKKSAGRKSVWQDCDVDDLVDIIANDESFKRNLIFSNVKKQKNTQVYTRVLSILNERYSGRHSGSSFPFSIQQIRNKFKWCVSTCKKICLTVQTATGIKRIQDEKGYGQWFNLLYPLIKSRDSCQPDQAIEPDAKKNKETNSDNDDGSDMFVPVKNSCSRKRKIDRVNDALLETAKVLKRAIENDPTKEMLAIMREEIQQAREQDQKFYQLLTAMSQQPAQAELQPGPSYCGPPPPLPPPWYSNNTHRYQMGESSEMSNFVRTQTTQRLLQQSQDNGDPLMLFGPPNTYHQL